MKSSIALLSVILFTAFITSMNVYATSRAPYRMAKLLPREHGYNNFKDTVIADKKTFDAHIAKVSKDGGWNKKNAYLKALKEAKIDFSKEKLILIRHNEGSGSVKVAFQVLKFQGDTLYCQIKREAPAIGTMDMAYYAYGLIVLKRIQKVDLKIQGKKGKVIK